MNNKGKTTIRSLNESDTVSYTHLDVYKRQIYGISVYDDFCFTNICVFKGSGREIHLKRNNHSES